MTENEILAGLILTVKAEREGGYEGWARPPEHMQPQCDLLVERGLAEKKEFDRELFYRPTAEGERVCNLTINRVQ